MCSFHVKLICDTVAEEHLQGLAEWQQPRAGMFAWMKLGAGITDADQILDKLKEEKVVVVPGTCLKVPETLHSVSWMTGMPQRCTGRDCKHGLVAS